MRHKKIGYSIIIILFLTSLILAGIIFHNENQTLEIVFLDVGQGDAILIQRGSNQILIDGGANEQKELAALGKYIPFWDRTIEVMIATHPDQDHIGGLLGVMKNYEVCEVINNSAHSDSLVYASYLKMIEDKKIERLRGSEGMNIKLGDMLLAILYPGENLTDNPKDTNADSLVAKLTYRDNSFIFTGDFPTEEDAKIFSLGEDLSAKVLKVAHHGSKYATSEEFLDKVKPREAVISVGKNNRYGHPAPEVIEKLKARGILVKRTDEIGDIIYEL